MNRHNLPLTSYAALSVGVGTALCVFKLSRKSKLAGLNEEGDSIMNKHLSFLFRVSSIKSASSVDGYFRTGKQYTEYSTQNPSKSSRCLAVRHIFASVISSLNSRKSSFSFSLSFEIVFVEVGKAVLIGPSFVNYAKTSCTCNRG